MNNRWDTIGERIRICHDMKRLYAVQFSRAAARIAKMKAEANALCKLLGMEQAFDLGEPTQNVEPKSTSWDFADVPAWANHTTQVH